MDIKEEEEVPQVTPERNETADTLTETGNSTENKGLKAAGERLKERAAKRKRLILRDIELKRIRRVRRKTIPKYTYCKNCGTELKGMYCHRCGQYALDVEQPFWKYIKQYFENVYQFDGKVWVTIWMLFRRPGFLTTEFNAGKIVSYVHPMRLLMFITVLFFLFFFTQMGKWVNVVNNSQPDNSLEIFEDLRENSSVWSGLTALDKSSTIAIVADSSALARFPELFEIVECSRYKMTEPDSPVRDTLTVNVAGGLIDRTGLEPLQKWRGVPLYALTSESAGPEQEAENLKKAAFENNFLSYASKWTPILILLLAPFLALFSKVLYRKYKIGYMGNFVFVLHLNSFVFIILAAYLLLNGFFPAQSTVWTWLFFLYLLYYTTVASHKVYAGTGWVKCAVKSILMWTAFLLVLAAALIGLIVLIALKMDVV